MKRILSFLVITLLFATVTAKAAKVAQAIWTEGNTTLTFTYAEPVSVGSTYGGQKVTNVWSGTAVTATGDTPGWIIAVSGTLTTVKFDASFKNVKPTSCYRWFQSCGNLNTIVGIANFNTSNVTNMRAMFCYCYSLTSLDLSSFNTSNVKDMNSMFYGCPSLTSLNLSGFNTANVTKMAGMFDGCSSLTSLNLSNFNTAKVTDMRSMFYDCSSLKSLNLSSFNTANVTNMDWMFSICSSLTSLNLSNFNTANVKDMGGMFFNCSSLTSLNLSSFNTANVTNMERMFYGCSSLTSLNLSSFNTAKVTDMRFMFYDCSSLTSLNLSSFNTANVRYMERMFYGCSSLTSLNLSSFNTANVTYMERMFSSCSSLTSLNLSNFNTAKVTDMSFMFYDCSSLTSLNLSSFNTADVMYMERMFYGCSSLTSLNLSSFNTSNVTDMSGMFQNCTALPVLDLLSLNTGKVTSCASMFSGIADHVFIYMPSTTKSIVTALRPKNMVLKYAANDLRCANTVLSDGQTLTLPYGFTATGGVTYERSIPGKTGEASAVFLPYSCPIPEGVTAYTLRTGEQKLLAKDRVMFEAVDGGVMAAYTPYLIINNEDDLTSLNTTTDTEVLPTTTAAVEKTFGGLRFTGTVQSIPNADAAAMSAYSLQGGNKWQKVTATEAQITPYRAFLTSTSGKATLGTFYQYGDANNDGKVDIGDVTAIINRINHAESSTFDADAADVNSDSVIDIGDVTGVINVINQ